MARLFVSGTSTWLSNTAAAPITVQPLTLACWFWPIADVTNALVSVGVSGNNNNRWTINSQNNAAGNNVTAQSRSTFNGIATSATSFTRNSGWNHVCGVFTSDVSRTVYLNGAGKATDTTGVGPSGMDSLYIGANMGLSANGFDGRIAEVGIWNVSLTDAEVLALASGVSPLRVRTGNLVCYFPLVGGTAPERNWYGSYGPLALSVGAPAVVGHAPVARFSPADGWLPYVVTAAPAAPAVTRRRLLMGAGV